MRPDPPDLPPVPEPADLEASRLDGVRLQSESFAGQRRPGLGLVDCELRGCDLANLDAPGAAWRRVHVERGRLTGVDLSESTLSDVVLADCRADLSAFAGARLERVLLSSCLLTQADFQLARLRAVVFEDCDLTGADLSGTRFESVELRGCRLEGVRGLERLDGVRMPWTDVLANAGVFAAACGVVVLDG